MQTAMQRPTLVAFVALTLVVIVGFASLFWATGPDERLVKVQPTPRKVLTEVGATYRPEEASFSVRFKDIVSPYRVMSSFVMPGDVMALDVPAPAREATYSADAEGGRLEGQGPASWLWHAPDSAGIYPIHIDEALSGETVTINAFVMVPYDLADEQLEGFRIGQYKREPFRGDTAYAPPRGFVRVMPEDRDVLVSPHFRLGEFLSKQESTYPKFLLLRERLLLKLELLLREVNRRGISVPTLHVMSAFRTPYYNRSIGNDTDYSSHLYGAAADIFIDVNDDAYMDDLNDDGDVTRDEAVMLANVVEERVERGDFGPFVGGLGIYGPAPHRGPFIHIDVRGSKVRW